MPICLTLILSALSGNWEDYIMHSHIPGAWYECTYQKMLGSLSVNQYLIMYIVNTYFNLSITMHTHSSLYPSKWWANLNNAPKLSDIHWDSERVLDELFGHCATYWKSWGESWEEKYKIEWKYTNFEWNLLPKNFHLFSKVLF